MSVLINNGSEDQFTSFGSINGDVQTISIYLLWRSNVDEEFKIQALFGKSLKYDLEPVERFRSEHKLEIIVYRLECKIPIESDEYTKLSYENNNSIMNKYQLRISTKTMNISAHYDDTKQRTINIDDPYQFLFDVHFQNNILPLSKGSHVDLWSQLCLYTYFLIKNNMYDTFNHFMQQFVNESSIDNVRKLTQHQLDMFFYVSYTYLPQINHYLNRDKNAIKIFLQMFGRLPIDKDNFKFDNISFNSLASELYDYIKKYLNDLLQTINHNDSLLVIQGLTIFMSAQMLGNQTTFNTFALIGQMRDYPEKQELIVNLLLKRLVELQMTIKNDTWTNLFFLTTDKHLLFNCLELVTSLDDYLIVLQHIIKHNSINEQMKIQLTNNFDKLISRVDFIMSLENILILLRNLQPQYRTTICSSTEDMNIFQSIIKSSNLLRQNINVCLENLDINKISLELLRELFELDHLVSILVIDKTSYLIKTIINHQNRTGNFYVTWFICFLCDKHYQNNSCDQQNFHRLLDVWLNYIKNDRDMLLQIIAKLDTLLDQLQIVIINDNNDNRLDVFRENMLTACFQPHIIFQILIDICTKIKNEAFLHLYERKFIDDILMNNRNKLKLMEDQTNPLYHLLETSKIIDRTDHRLLTNLIAACAKLITINNEEIRYETFLHPSKKTCTYAVLFDQHLNDYKLFHGTMYQLDCLWNRWSHSGLTYYDIEKWKEHSTDEQIAFNKIWDKVQRHFKKSESIDELFKKADAEFSEKIIIRQAIVSALSIYCDKASDYSRAMYSLRDMLQELHEKPIRSVETPKDLQSIESIALKLNSFSTSRVWLKYFNQSFLKIEKRESQSNLSSNSLVISKSSDSDTDDEDDKYQSSLPVSVSNEIKIEKSPSTRRPTVSFIPNKKLPKDNLQSVEILNNVNKIFEEFHCHLIHICTDWKKEPIHEWIELFSDAQDVQSEFEILRTNLNLEISKELIDILHLWEKRNFIYHVCQGCLNLTKQFDIPLKEDDSNVLKTLIKLDENILGELCSFVYQEYLNQYVLHYSSNTLVVWSQFSIAIELIDFIISLSKTDFDNLLENVNDWDDKLVSLKTVQDFQTLKHYFDQVYKSIKQLRQDKRRFSLPNILACFDNDSISNQFGNVQEFFTNCSNELPNMKQSHSELTDKELSKRRLIINIMQNSLIKFIQVDKFDVLLLLQKLNFSDLSELRDRARLIEYSYRNRMKKDNKYQIQQFELFIIFVTTIETILNTLNSLYIAGHPIVSEITLTKREFQCNENQFDNLINFSKNLQEISLSWENTLCEKYLIYPELTYFSCKQFDMIEEFIYNKDRCDEEEYGYHLLKYIDLEPKLIRQLYLSNEQQHTAEDRLEKLGQILSQQRCPIGRLSQQNRINQKIFIIETFDNGILKAILSLFKRFNTLPNVNHLFYCTNETNWMEIRAFIYRCIYSQKFHQLIRPELLSISIQDQIIHLIRQIIENNSQHLFCLGIITTIPIANIQLIDGLKSLQIVQIIPEHDLMNDMDFRVTLSNLIKKCTIVTSRITGLGKSHTIRDECLKMHKEYIKFPVNGDIQADLIAKRLLKEAQKFKEGAIHFDLGVIDNYRQINDLINCLVLFRSFCFGQIAVSIPIETPIYIELDCSSHSNLMEHVILFQYIPSVFIDHINWQKIIITDSILFVVNYLKAIKDKSILTKDIKLEGLQHLKPDECVKLIQEYFFNGQNNDYVTWTRIYIYISVFYKLFLGFSQCSYFISEHLGSSQLRQSRMDILQTFLKSANQFTSISVEAVREQQRAAYNNNLHDIHQPQQLSNAIIRWDKIQPFTFIFSPTDDPIFVYKTEKDIPESLKNYFNLYNQLLAPKKSLQKRFSLLKSTKTSFFPDYKQLKHEELFQKLAKLSMKYFLKKAICAKCFRQYDYDTLTCENCLNTLDLLEKPNLPLDDANIEAFQKRIAKIIEPEYVITADNYIKMLLVFLRVQSGVPVLIMGETGCGKTALINCLCRKILDDDLHIFRLHAGITNEKLLEDMNDLIIRAENLPPEKRLWIFFDEFNTMFNISLLKEIICERTLLGKILPKNMVFLGTCNPRRYIRNQAIFNKNVGIRKDYYETLKHRQNLFYTVTQIPETMLEYIWDYGHLDNDTEKTYIEATLKTCEDFANNPEIFTITVELISESHKFLRQLEDISSVSLRDVARYCRLYKWFHKYLADHFSDSVKLIKDSSRLALLLCYYFRLDSRENKSDYLKALDNRLCSIDNRSSHFIKSIERLLEREENRLVNQMQIPTDMARNRALQENIFVLFSCIINRIPVFLCGKPGASKTSAVQILMNNLKGLRSDNIIFRKLPELVAVTFQGSQDCTSKSIEQIFKRAEKFMKSETNSSLLPVIIFDEIGLAELSIHNPLKVLHSHLEIEECQFGFVGISNWRLDASKMNRALYVACLDPDDKELKYIGTFLSNTNINLNQENQFDENMILGLAQGYLDLQKRMTMEHKLENYFGLRDYYSLIKGIAHDCQKYPKRSQYETIYQQLIINFGGMYNGYDYMWEKFCSLIDRLDLCKTFQMPTPKELIQKSLTNRNSRHLMLIVDKESTIDHVERYITALPILNGSVKTLVGSQFEGDFISNETYTESYTTRVLMEIILHAETPITLVMRRMNHLYDNLYDLFNQNFGISGRKKYCRIALSSIYNPRCFVHDEFYCVILLNTKDVDISDPPFLNRFQKHYIQLDKLIEKRQSSLKSQLSDWLFGLPISNINTKFLLLNHLLIPYSSDYLCDLVIDICQDYDFTDEIILNSCKEKLIRACSIDFPLILSLDNDNEDLIDQYYRIHYNLLNISQLISSTFEQSFATKRIIYTYTHIYETIDYKNVEQVREIKLSSIKTELELINLLKTCSQKKNSSCIHIIRIDYHHENQHILSLKYNILNQWNELKDFHLWIIFHIQRNKLHQTENDVLFNGWDIIMIDDLNNKKKFISKEILIDPSYKNFLNKYQYKFVEDLFNEFIHRALSRFRYEFLSNEQQTKRYNHLFNLLNHEQDQFLRRIFHETIEYLIKTISNPDQTRFKDWRYDLISNYFISIVSRSFNEALQAIMILFYDTYFQLLIHHFESFNLIDSYIYLKENQTTNLKNFWYDCYKLSLNTIDKSIMNLKLIESHLINDLKLPYSIKENQKLKQISDILQIELTENEDDIELFIIKLLKEKSSYGEDLINSILNNNDLLDLYYHDQLILFHMENNFQLSIEFTLKLLTTNTKQSTMTRLIQLIAYPENFAEILRIFEDGFKLFDENILLENMNKQLITINSLEQNTNSFYSIIFQDEKFHLISPNNFQINEKFEFHPLCDPFIEITLMNLIEFIVSPILINKIGDIEQITSIYSSINQRVLKLSHYQVNNLEKLCSFMSLLRCIQTLNPTQSLQIFQKCCTDYKFDAIFQTCDDIHQFIQNLERYTIQQGCEYDRTSTKSILLKLEIEFLKNWLVDHSDQYPNILKLINQIDNDLWKYSAKIFSYIVGKLDLLENIECSYDPLTDETDEISQLNEYLSSFKKSEYKIHRLFVNRIYLDLILRSPIENHSIKTYLNDYYENFEKSIQYVTTFYLMNPSEEYSHVQLIRLLAWLKYYSQLYSIALVNNFKFQHLDNIDHYLTNNKLPFCLTLKLFILKQMLNILKTDLNTFQTSIQYRNTTWLREFFEKFDNKETKNERNLIPPIPLVEAEDEFSQVNQTLSNFTDENAINRLIFSCSTNQYLCYCLYLWFIKYYIQYSNKNFQSNDHYRYLFQRNLSNEAKIFFQPIGIHFLQMLCTNFSLNSYFHLNSSMSDRDIAIRVVILNIFALTLSFKSFSHSNWINTILFDKNSKMPTNYFEHFQSLCLFGLMDNNRIISNMRYICASIKHQSKSGYLTATRKYIYRCSKDCLYLFCFSHCGIPNQKSTCPFCKKEIGSSKYGVLIERNPPQIKMTTEEGLQFIEKYIEKYNQENRYGYYEIISYDQSTLDQKPHHLNISITYRFLHLFIHSILFILQEFNYLSNENLQQWNIPSELFFQNHIEKDYELLEKCISDSQYCYIWLFQLLNNMLNGFVEPLIILNSNDRVIQIEKLIEQQLIIPHSVSKMKEINKYKNKYNEYTRQEETDNNLIHFLDERTESDRRYPLLNFFNITQNLNQNPIEDFSVNLKTMAQSHVKTNYPLTMYLLEHIDILSNIQHLYSIIQFVNYLRDKYNYRISRQHAVSKSIQECLDDTKGEDLFKKFSNAWSQINLSEVSYGCQIRTFDRHMNKERKLAFFSLNVSKDDSSLILSATLQTIAKLQNKIVNYFHNEIINSPNIRHLPIHMIEREHLLHLDKNFLNSKIIKDALVINFEYGQSKDIIYDYEEIEMALRSLINRLPLINIDKFRKIQYQFELYSENNALINDVRHHIEQKPINDDKRRQYRYTLQSTDENDILQYLGSLDYIFTYIQNRNYRSNISTIQLFVNEYIHSKSFHNQNLFLQSPFASIKLEYIIDLYELIEEIAFDKKFRNSIEEKLNDSTIESKERKSIQDKFLSMTIDNKQIATSLHNIHQWISTLKRFMVRILHDYVDLNIPIEIYLKRTDLWNCQITEDDIETIQLDESILLKHTFIILIGLENRLDEKNEQKQRTTTKSTQKSSKQMKYR